MKIDGLDMRILSALQRDGRTPRTALAEVFGVRPPEISERINKLEALGVISGYHAHVDASRIPGIVLVHVAVGISNREADDFDRFDTAMRETPEVIACDAVSGTVTSGPIDYMLKIVAADADHFQEIFDRLLNAGLSIATYRTFISEGEIKPEIAIPLEHIAREVRRSRAAS